jgi:hypothetical protein
MKVYRSWLRLAKVPCSILALELVARPWRQGVGHSLHGRLTAGVPRPRAVPVCAIIDATREHASESEDAFGRVLRKMATAPVTEPKCFAETQSLVEPAVLYSLAPPLLPRVAGALDH